MHACGRSSAGSADLRAVVLRELRVTSALKRSSTSSNTAPRPKAPWHADRDDQAVLDQAVVEAVERRSRSPCISRP